MNKETAFSILLFLIVFSVSMLFVKEIVMKEDTTPTKEEQILSVITENNPSLLDDNTPVIKIDSVSTFDEKWHIVTIKSLRSADDFVHVKVIMLDTDGILKVIAGPDTYFTEAELLKYNVPDSVILELQKS